VRPPPLVRRHGHVNDPPVGCSVPRPAPRCAHPWTAGSRIDSGGSLLDAGPHVRTRPRMHEGLPWVHQRTGRAWHDSVLDRPALRQHRQPRSASGDQPPCTLVGPAANWPSALRRPRRLVTSRSDLVALRCVVGVEKRRDLTPLTSGMTWANTTTTTPVQRAKPSAYSRSVTSPRAPSSPTTEHVSTDMGGQANHEADRQAPVQDSLLAHGPPPPSLVLAYPVHGALITEGRLDLAGEPLTVGTATRQPGPWSLSSFEPGAETVTSLWRAATTSRSS